MRRRSNPLARFWVHTVQVETHLPQATNGSDSYAPAQPVTGWLEDTTTLVRAPDGNETVSSARFFCPVGSAALFAPDSRVTLPSRQAQVISVNVNDSASLGLPDHAVISLT